VSTADGFTVWYAVIFVLGLSAACQVGRARAIGIVSFLWVMSVALRVILPVVAR
jgi:hypothetical protein